MPSNNDSMAEIAAEARHASQPLSRLSREAKDRALRAAASALLQHSDEIIEANHKDLEDGLVLVEEGKISKPMLDRLKLDTTKLAEISKMVESVASLEDPAGRTLFSIKMDEGLHLFKVTVPFGVIAAIFESRPDVLPQIASLSIKSGNSVILKGGSEAKESNRAIFNVMEQSFVDEGLPKGCIMLVEGRSAVEAILKLEGQVDLIVPRGGYDFVRYIQSNTKIPVLGHSSGLCHIYVDGSADPIKAVDICHDARVQYPAACNSMKILLVDGRVAESLLPKIAARLVESGVQIKGCKKVLEILRKNNITATEASDADWSTEYLELVLPTKVVEGVDGAIDHINRYSSKHTDSIITEDAASARRFLTMVDSSTVMHNASTRFSDGYRYGLGAEVGISTNKVHARGPVGLEGLVTTKYILLGSGQIVSDYIGGHARPFLHEKTGESWDGRL